MIASKRRDDDFSLLVGNSRRRRRLKKPGALVPGFTGVWGRSATNKHASVYTEALLAITPTDITFIVGNCQPLPQGRDQFVPIEALGRLKYICTAGQLNKNKFNILETKLERFKNK